MKKEIKTTLAVAVSLLVVGWIFFGNLFVNFFSTGEIINPQEIMITTGVEVRDIVLGTGETALAGDLVTVHYVGTLIDGRVFDSSRDRGAPFSFTLGAGEVIRGWDEGVSGMRVGGTRQLIIAPDFGYGDRATGPIPGNSILIFEVELLGVEK